MTPRRPLLMLILASSAALALACGGADLGSAPATPPLTQASSPAAPTAPSAASSGSVASGSGDPLVGQCQQAIRCGCPNNPDDTVESCVEKWRELVAWGTQVSTIGCFAQLDCASMCDISVGAGQRCAMLLEADTLTARASIEQRAHETNMRLIRDMNGSGTVTEVYDENGIKLYEY